MRGVPLDRQLIKLLDDYVDRIMSWKELSEENQIQAQIAIQQSHL